tara:strand:+ start:30 stop:536 length:507 start_codon:yes stop_codon:yes gene_type:complete
MRQKGDEKKMKKIGEYTARGIVSEEQTEAGIPQRIPLNDGNPRTAYRVVRFQVWGADYGGSTNPDCAGKLSKNDDGITSFASFMRADDHNQVAWSQSTGQTDSGGGGGFGESIIDPDNLIVEDLYVYARSAHSTDVLPINYLVVLEKYEISDWQGALTMARDRAQGDV